jgi:outer membrane protein OmpA-like peptidoglycan-associated protein
VKVKAKHGSTVATQTITVHVVDNGDPVVPGDEVKINMVHFDLDSWQLDARAIAKLDAAIKAIKKAGYTKVFLYGHTDNQGPAPRDVGLAKRRARQVYLYLGARLKNVDFVRQGFSRNKPARKNVGEANLRFNRRVEIWAK